MTKEQRDELRSCLSSGRFMTVDIGTVLLLLDAADRCEELEAAIRKHMNMRGDDRCYIDDHELYTVLPEGDTRPENEIAVTIENCQSYIDCRQQGREYVSPQRRIEELEACLGRILDHQVEYCDVGIYNCSICHRESSPRSEHAIDCPVRRAEELLKSSKS